MDLLTYIFKLGMYNISWWLIFKMVGPHEWGQIDRWQYSFMKKQVNPMIWQQQTVKW